ncbi:hypothetical protein [Desulfobacter sp.]|uniref:hypothetical protein n=1 Tax=Desulfobacter sp. TaxID=2294 RepID=UPI000E901C31|nr:hypothetical protein [Desulfobacter sp.]HBT88781.1 hypothetical protein [Desulfobacter sp.]
MKYSGLISILAMVLTLFFCATAFVSYAQNPFTTKTAFAVGLVPCPGLGNRLAPVIETLAGMMVAALGIMCLLANF